MWEGGGWRVKRVERMEGGGWRMVEGEAEEGGGPEVGGMYYVTTGQGTGWTERDWAALRCTALRRTQDRTERDRTEIQVPTRDTSPSASRCGFG